MILLKAEPVVQKMKTEAAQLSHQILRSLGRKPQLTVVLVGNDPASQIYVRNKQTQAQQWGIDARTLHLPESISELEFEKQIHELNTSSDVDAILVQLPLPSQLSPSWVMDHLLPSKDADGVTTHNLGGLMNQSGITTPCTPQGVMRILNHYGISVAGKNVVVVGRSLIVGKPMAAMLTNQDATVTLCHSKTQNLREFTQRADLVVVAAGISGILDISRGDFKKNAVVIDVGMHRASIADGKTKLRGDVNGVEAAGSCLAALTPVPGGVGPMTIACLMNNTLHLCAAKLGIA
ncbi:MAG TPA: bifunctional 5,10-methylenetetrahydrofolate dehydrogenase/5,10-methenyltetrahydrofolate cyclohydrolase [Pseudobdellovibrionaceae bacterium]|nr:bifunctional 5,10-methylenetetrahydrofolate dehydrogenase/5,10-methenyltetrahydrofolate cyclohydrolase [Pseudobdellovibrionaceae bacterium]